MDRNQNIQNRINFMSNFTAAAHFTLGHVASSVGLKCAERKPSCTVTDELITTGLANAVILALNLLIKFQYPHFFSERHDLGVATGWIATNLGLVFGAVFTYAFDGNAYTVTRLNEGAVISAVSICFLAYAALIALLFQKKQAAPEPLQQNDAVAQTEIQTNESALRA